MIANTTTRFPNREYAAVDLAAALIAYRGRHPLIRAITPAGVTIGRVVTDYLDGELDFAPVKQLTPRAMCCGGVGVIDDRGNTYIGRHALAPLSPWDMSPAMRHDRDAQLDLLRRQRAVLAAGSNPADPRGRVVIVVDDGLLQGVAMGAALAAVRRRQPAQLLCAVPVASKAALDFVRPLADDVICLDVAERLHCLGDRYQHLPLPADDAVRAMLMASPPGPTAAVALPSVPASSVVLRIPCGDAANLRGALEAPRAPIGIALMAHAGSGAALTARGQYIARKLRAVGIATLLVDLMTPDEEKEPRDEACQVRRLAQRLSDVVTFVHSHTPYADLPLGCIGTGMAAAAALRQAAVDASGLCTVVSIAGRPDRAGVEYLRQVRMPTLLIVPEGDPFASRNEQALHELGGQAEYRVLEAERSAFSERPELQRVAAVLTEWLGRHLSPLPCSTRATIPSRMSCAEMSRT